MKAALHLLRLYAPALACSLWLLTACSSDSNDTPPGEGAGAGGSAGGAGGGASGTGGATGAGGAGSAGGGPTQGASGGGGGPASAVGFLRFANLAPASSAEPEPAPLGIDLCLRPSGQALWQGPILEKAGVSRLEPSQLSDHTPLPAGTYLARALPAGVRDCESPNAIESEGALGEGKYQTLAITRNADGEPSLTPYADGAPSAAGGQVELSFAHALNEADYAAVKIEPMGLIVEAFKANQSTIAPDPLLFRVFHPDGPAESWFEPDAAMPLEAPFGYSVFLYMAELDATLLSAITCRNGPSVSVSPQPQGSRTCAPTKMVRRVIPYAAGRLPSAL